MLLLLALVLSQLDQRQSTVGMPRRIEALVLPGTELEAKEQADAKAPVVLRIRSVYPHGTAFRYELEYYGLEPGKFDLRDYLQRKDKSSAKDLPNIRVTVEPTLPPGQILPHAPAPQAPPNLGGYRALLWVAAILWILGLLWILLGGRKSRHALHADRHEPVTLADRLRPLVEGAIAGSLSKTQHAELERTMLAYWRKRLKLEQCKPADAIGKMRDDPEASAAVNQLEAWLHQPVGIAGEIDIVQFLRPYQDLPADAVPSSNEDNQ